MEAGYDYLLLRGRSRRHLFGLTAILLVAFGALFLAGGGAYYVYAAKARADLAQLNVTLPVTDHPLLAEREATASSRATPDVIEPIIPVAPPPGISAVGIADQNLFAGDPKDAQAWNEPLAYEPQDYRQRVLLQGFTPLSKEEALSVGSQPAATRIILPGLGIDSGVNELSILNLADSRAYRTPINTVGHIPESANPGESGSSWFFGHLESPIAGEGSVFFQLPKIANMLRNGEDVFVVTDNDAYQYLYRITSTKVVHQKNMRLFDSGNSNIHLVACVPRLVYDHRIIVTGELVGFK